jgi:hypothetical protein
MKFLSKQSIYRVILRPGQPAEKITGRAAVNGLSIRFENNEAIIDEKAVDPVTNRSVIELLKEHEAFGQEFIEVVPDEVLVGPWNSLRKGMEPEHDIISIDYGHVGKSLNPKPKLALNSDQKKALEEMARTMAVEMAKEMAPQLAKDILKSLVETKNKAGRPPKAEKDITEAESKPEETPDKE